VTFLHTIFAEGNSERNDWLEGINLFLNCLGCLKDLRVITVTEIPEDLTHGLVASLKGVVELISVEFLPIVGEPGSVTSVPGADSLP